MTEDAKGRRLEYVGRNNEGWKIRYHVGGDTQELKSKDKARPELIAAFEALHECAVNGSDHLDPRFHEKRSIEISGMEHDWKSTKNRRNTTVYYRIKYPKHYKLNAETKNMLSDTKSDEAKLDPWPIHCIDLFNHLEPLVMAYVDGDRIEIQMSMIEKGDNNGDQEELGLDNEFEDDDQTQEIIKHTLKGVAQK